MKHLFMSLALAGVLVFSSCGPKDSKIQESATEALKTVPGVSVSVEKGVATITGAVSDDATKAAAETAIKGIKGVKSVTNEITVAAPVTTTTAPTVVTSTDALTAAVKDATKDFPGITAEVNDGVIKVAGTISAAKWKTLKQSLDGLNPKKVDATGITIK